METTNEPEERKPGLLTRLYEAVLGEHILRDLSLRELSKSGVGVTVTLAAVMLFCYDVVTAIPFALAALAALMWMWAENRLHIARQRELARAKATYGVLDAALQVVSNRPSREG